MGINISQIKNWYSDQYIWVQVALKELLNKNLKTSEVDASYLADICINSICGNPVEYDVSIDWSSVLIDEAKLQLHINKLYNINNINALKMGAEIKFNDENLTIIYGKNGAGKTGFTRILKKLAYPNIDIDILPNTYIDTVNNPLEFDALFCIDNNPLDEHFEITSENKFIGVYNQIEIFDQEKSSNYINQKSNISYKPFIIDLLASLAEVFDLVKNNLNHKLQAISIPVPSSCSEDIKNSKAYKLYENINYKTKIEQFSFDWSENDEKILLAKKKDLENGITASITKLSNQNKSLESLLGILNEINNSYCDKNCKHIQLLKDNMETSRVEMEQISSALKNDSDLDCIGSETWKAMWESARKFYEEEAYKENVFPPSEGQLCVLCQQPINKSTALKMEIFNKFILSESNKKYSNYKSDLKTSIEKLYEFNQDKYIDMLCQQSEIDTKIYKDIIDEIDKAKLIKGDLLSESNKYNGDSTVGKSIALLEAAKEEKDNEIAKLRKLNPEEHEQKIRNEIFEQEGQKWLTANEKAIEQTIALTKRKSCLIECIQQTNTTGLSRKISEISNILFTESYINSFKTELVILDAGQLNAELKTTNTKGANKTEVIINSIQNEKPANILSEGEKRIVSLAGFLVDVNLTNPNSPLVFDDPISSLDIDYENAFINRVLDLSKNRQIIIFTHRLAFFNELCCKAKEKNININEFELCKLENRAGHVTPSPCAGKRTVEALNKIKYDDLAKAGKLYKNGEIREAESRMQLICKNMRVIMENIIEYNILGGIITRYSREVHTKLVKNLYKIDQEDCKSLDELMSKYSYNEHSQPAEKPARIFTIDEISVDIDTLQKIIQTYKSAYN